MQKKTDPTSTARHATFLLWAGATAATTLLAIFLLIELTMLAGRPDLPFEILLDHQRNKLAGNLGDIVFVGDSSLGNAVDAKLFSRLSGRKATNLALTAGYGYQGTLQMVKAVLRRDHPSDIVIMQTAEMMMRRPDPSHFDLVPSANLAPLARFRRVWLDTMNLDQLNEALQYALSAKVRRAAALRGPIFRNDYIAQRDEKARLPQAGHFDSAEINFGNGAVLGSIDALCRANKVNCVYLHGPLAAPVCRHIHDYLAAVDRIVRGIGLVLAADDVECLAPEEVGDQPDHTAPDAKEAMTRRIYARLQPYLTATRPSASP